MITRLKLIKNNKLYFRRRTTKNRIKFNQVPLRKNRMRLSLSRQLRKLLRKNRRTRTRIRRRRRDFMRRKTLRHIRRLRRHLTLKQRTLAIRRAIRERYRRSACGRFVLRILRRKLRTLHNRLRLYSLRTRRRRFQRIVRRPLLQGYRALSKRNQNTQIFSREIRAGACAKADFVSLLWRRSRSQLHFQRRLGVIARLARVRRSPLNRVLYAKKLWTYLRCYRFRRRCRIIRGRRKRYLVKLRTVLFPPLLDKVTLSSTLGAGIAKQKRVKAAILRYSPPTNSSFHSLPAPARRSVLAYYRKQWVVAQEYAGIMPLAAEQATPSSLKPARRKTTTFYSLSSSYRAAVYARRRLKRTRWYLRRLKYYQQWRYSRYVTTRRLRRLFRLTHGRRRPKRKRRRVRHQARRRKVLRRLRVTPRLRRAIRRSLRLAVRRNLLNLRSRRRLKQRAHQLRRTQRPRRTVRRMRRVAYKRKRLWSRISPRRYRLRFTKNLKSHNKRQKQRQLRKFYRRVYPERYTGLRVSPALRFGGINRRKAVYKYYLRNKISRSYLTVYGRRVKLRSKTLIKRTSPNFQMLNHTTRHISWGFSATAGVYVQKVLLQKSLLLRALEAARYRGLCANRRVVQTVKLQRRRLLRRKKSRKFRKYLKYRPIKSTVKCRSYTRYYCARHRDLHKKVLRRYRYNRIKSRRSHSGVGRKRFYMRRGWSTSRYRARSKRLRQRGVKRARRRFIRKYRSRTRYRVNKNKLVQVLFKTKLALARRRTDSPVVAKILSKVRIIATSGYLKPRRPARHIAGASRLPKISARFLGRPRFLHDRQHHIVRRKRAYQALSAVTAMDRAARIFNRTLRVVKRLNHVADTASRPVVRAKTPRWTKATIKSIVRLAARYKKTDRAFKDLKAASVILRRVLPAYGAFGYISGKSIKMLVAARLIIRRLAASQKITSGRRRLRRQPQSSFLPVARSCGQYGLSRKRIAFQVVNSAGRRTFITKAIAKTLKLKRQKYYNGLLLKSFETRKTTNKLCVGSIGRRFLLNILPRRSPIRRKMNLKRQGAVHRVWRFACRRRYRRIRALLYKVGCGLSASGAVPNLRRLNVCARKHRRPHHRAVRQRARIRRTTSLAVWRRTFLSAAYASGFVPPKPLRGRITRSRRHRLLLSFWARFLGVKHSRRFRSTIRARRFIQRSRRRILRIKLRPRNYIHSTAAVALFRCLSRKKRKSLRRYLSKQRLPEVRSTKPLEVQPAAILGVGVRAVKKQLVVAGVLRRRQQILWQLNRQVGKYQCKLRHRSRVFKRKYVWRHKRSESRWSNYTPKAWARKLVGKLTTVSSRAPRAIVRNIRLRKPRHAHNYHFKRKRVARTQKLATRGVSNKRHFGRNWTRSKKRRIRRWRRRVSRVKKRVRLRRKLYRDARRALKKKYQYKPLKKSRRWRLSRLHQFRDSRIRRLLTRLRRRLHGDARGAKFRTYQHVRRLYRLHKHRRILRLRSAGLTRRRSWQRRCAGRHRNILRHRRGLRCVRRIRRMLRRRSTLGLRGIPRRIRRILRRFRIRHQPRRRLLCTLRDTKITRRSLLRRIRAAVLLKRRLWRFRWLRNRPTEAHMPRKAITTRWAFRCSVLRRPAYSMLTTSTRRRFTGSPVYRKNDYSKNLRSEFNSRARRAVPFRIIRALQLVTPTVSLSAPVSKFAAPVRSGTYFLKFADLPKFPAILYRLKTRKVRKSTLRRRLQRSRKISANSVRVVRLINKNRIRLGTLHALKVRQQRRTRRKRHVNNDITSPKRKRPLHGAITEILQSLTVAKTQMSKGGRLAARKLPNLEITAAQAVSTNKHTRAHKIAAILGIKKLR